MDGEWQARASAISLARITMSTAIGESLRHTYSSILDHIATRATR